MARDPATAACIVGIGASRFGRRLPESPLALGAAAFKAALADSGLNRDDVDGVSIHTGAPLGLDYDRVAEGFGLDTRYVNQSWLHGRFVTNALQHAALAVENGLADVVACVTVAAFSPRKSMGGDRDSEGGREEGGTHGESPPYGLTAPASGAALGMQRYMHVHGATSEQLAAVPIAMRKHACLNPAALMRTPLTLAEHQASRMVADPLHLFDCCLMTDGAVVVLVTSAERARDLAQRPVRVAGMQGIRSGREEFIFAPRGMGIAQQTDGRAPARARDMEVYASADVSRARRAGAVHLRRVLPAGAVHAGTLRLLRAGRGRRLRAGRPDRAGRRAADEHLRRAAVGGACRGLEFGRRDGAPTARHRRAVADRRCNVPPMGHRVG